MIETFVGRPGPTAGTVTKPDGSVVDVPSGWALLPPGDAGLTRRVKAAGPHWVVQEKRGRRTFSRGVWASAVSIEAERTRLDAERSTDAYAAKQKSAAKRRDAQQAAYVSEFTASVEAYLDFAPAYAAIAEEMAKRIAAHATPVGSGTVARTKRISVKERAEAAVIAWMRHQTTAYDDMAIPRVKGKRREVRRQLASRSKQLLASYRRGDCQTQDCPLQVALAKPADPSKTKESAQ